VKSLNGKRSGGKYLRLQGDGDYEGTIAFIPKEIELTPTLQVDLDRLAAANIPKSVRFGPATDLLMGVTRQSGSEATSLSGS